MNLSKKDIGMRLAEIRKSKGLSQDELAKLLNISRPSLTQIELGNRNIDIFELKNLAMTLGFTLDDFMSDQYTVKKTIKQKEAQQPDKLGFRIAVPEMKEEKFKNILLYILEKCSGKPNVGETVLYKLLYFSDFNYYEIYEEHLSGAIYRKLPFGPVPQHLDRIINQLIELKEIQRFKTDYHGYPQTRYIPLVKADLTQLCASEKEVMDRVIEQMSDWSASAISEYSHKDLPWKATKEGDVINYELTFYRDKPFSVRNYDNDKEEA